MATRGSWYAPRRVASLRTLVPELGEVPLLHIGDLAGGLYVLEVLTREKSSMEEFVKI